MNGLFRFINKALGLFSRERFRKELDEEMAFHRAQMERELLADGMSPDRARRAAAVRFGNAARLR